MENLHIDYAGMEAGQVAAWVLIATAAGYLARVLFRGAKLLGLWGDTAIGLIAIFLVGTLLRAFNFNLTDYLRDFLPEVDAQLLRLMDVAIVSLVGSIFLRATLKPFVKGGGAHAAGGGAHH